MRNFFLKSEGRTSVYAQRHLVIISGRPLQTASQAKISTTTFWSKRGKPTIFSAIPPSWGITHSPFRFRPLKNQFCFLNARIFRHVCWRSTEAAEGQTPPFGFPCAAMEAVKADLRAFSGLSDWACALQSIEASCLTKGAWSVALMRSPPEA